MPGKDVSLVVREDGGAWVASWEPFVLKSAFQPIFTFDHGKLVPTAYEALLRPFHDGEPVAPLVFFGELPAIARLKVEKVSHRLHLLNASAFLPADADIFINIDPSIFVDRAVAEETIGEMRGTLAETGTNPGRVVCEITEKKAVSQDTLFWLAAQLRASGLRIAVDDYGVDESDMARIRELHPHLVKFDADWVSRLMGSETGLALLSAMVTTFEEKGIRTLFEGIEESWQIELAERSGVSMIQGFALGRPLLVPDIYGFPASGGDDEPPDTSSPASGKRGGPQPAKPFGRRNRQR